jgi:hypothetical protein
VIQTIRVLLLAAAMAAATWIAWWLVPVVAAVYGVIARKQRGSALVAGLAAMIAWGGLLIGFSTSGPVGAVASTIGALLQIRTVGVYALTLAFPGLLASTAAVVARAVATYPAGASATP